MDRPRSARAGRQAHRARAILGLLLGATFLSAIPASAEHDGPHVQASFTPALADGGWARGTVFVNLTCSGRTAACAINYTLEGENVEYAGAGFEVSGERDHTINASARNVPEGAPSFDTFLVRIDDTPPAVSLPPTCAEPGANGWCHAAVTYAPTADAGAGSPLASFTCAVGAEPVACVPQCEIPCALTVSAEGATPVWANATDAAGNVASATSTARVDTAKPSVTIESSCATPGVSPWCAAGLSFNVAAADTASTPTLLCRIDEGTPGACASVLASLPVGTHTVSANATDASGRSNETSLAYSLEGPPTVSLSLSGAPTPGADGWHLAPVTIAIATSDVGSGVAQVELSVDGGRWYPHAASTLAASVGDHVYRARVKDHAGNVAFSDALRVRLDTDAAPIVLSELSANTEAFSLTAPLTAKYAVLRPGDDARDTRISFAFNTPMDRNSTEGALVGAANWTKTWGGDDLWLNLTRADLAPGASAQVTLTTAATGRHGGHIAANVTRETVARALHAYTVSEVPYAFVNITANGTDTLNDCDDCSTTVTLPFPVSFFGANYTTVHVSSNGFVTFSNAATSEYSPPFLPGTSASNLVGVYWEDLETHLGEPGGFLDRIYVRETGAAPERVFIVSWSVLHHFNDAPPSATFQLKLFENSDRIEAHYENAWSDGGRHLIGIMDASRAKRLTYAQDDVSLAGKAIAFRANADITAPVIAAVETVVAEATGAAGAIVNYTAPAWSDDFGAAGTASCSPASGSLFALGESTVTCSATDPSGNTGASSFLVRVRDTTPPQIAAKPEVVAEATSPGGANVVYTAPATSDAVSGAGNATCTPASGSSFAMGTTTVTCTASDGEGNGATSSFPVRVVDTTPPTVTIALDPAEPNGIGGWYTRALVANVTASDAVGVNASTLAYSLDGTTWTNGTSFAAFPEGTTTFRARAADAAGNLRETNVTVRLDTQAPGVTASAFQANGAAGTLTFTFSEPMDRARTEGAVVNGAGWTASWNEASTILTLARAEVPFGTHTIALSTAATDAHGVPLAAPHTHSFERAAPPPPPPPVTPPDAPQGFTAVLAGERVRLAWSAPASDGGASVTGYKLYVNDAPAVPLTGTTYDAGVMPRGRQNVFAVTAVNSAGESPAAQATLAIPPVSTLTAPTPDATGWHASPPTISFDVDPSDAVVLYDIGTGPIEYAASFTLPDGDVVLRWHATSGGVDEAERSERFRVDTTAPSLSGPSAVGGEDVQLAIDARDAASGIVAVEAVLVPRGSGSPLLVPLFGRDGAHSARAGAPPGTYDVEFRARDAAGHESRAPGGSVTVAAAVAPGEEQPDTPAADPAPFVGIPLEPASTPDTGGGSDEGQAPPEETTATPEPSTPPPPPTIAFDAENFAAGVRGTIVIRLENVDNVENVRWVLVHPNGTEEILAVATPELAWDTTTVADGYYTVEARRGNAPLAAGELGIQSSHEATLASARVLVRNPVAPPVEVAGAVVGAVLVTAVTQAGLSAAASGATSSVAGAAGGGFDAFGFAQEVAIDAGQDKLRDKTRDRDRRRRIRSLVAGAVSLAILAPLWAFSETDGWSLTAWIPLVPIIGAAAALVILMKYTSESALAFATGARPRVRLWIAGAASLFVSAVVFRNPFGYPAYVDEVDESEERHTWRMQAGRALATIAGATAFMLPFLILAPWLPWSFVSVGLLLAVTNVATAAIPFGPLPGRDVWRWNKLLAVVVAIGGFALYVGFAAALAPVWLLWAIGVAGGIAYATALLRFRKSMRAKAVRIPVQVPVPVRVEDEPAAQTTPTTQPVVAASARDPEDPGRGNA